jgi:hypothetical protein
MFRHLDSASGGLTPPQTGPIAAQYGVRFVRSSSGGAKSVQASTRDHPGATWSASRRDRLRRKDIARLPGMPQPTD